MKIVIVTTSYPRFAGDAGGHFVEAQARGLVRQGHVVEVVAPGKPACTEERDGLRVRWLGGESAFGWPGAAARLQEAPAASVLSLVQAARRFTPSFSAALSDGGEEPARVIAHWLLPSVYPALLLAGYRGSLEAHAHGGDVRLLLKLPAPLRHAIVGEILARADRLTFASHSLRQTLLDGLDHAPRRALEQASEVQLPQVDYPEEVLALSGRSALRTRHRSTWFNGTDGLFATAVGRLIPSKCIELAIDAVADTPTAHLLIVGDGPTRAALEHRAARAGGRIAFSGQLDRHATLEAIAASDVLLHPSETEAAPTVVREARALGVPVVACGAGDIARWALADPSIHCVARNANAIAAALSTLDSNAASAAS